MILNNKFKNYLTKKMTSQSFKFKDHPRCPLCKTYSLFRFIPEAPNKVEITCRNHMNTSYFLDEYMESIANIEAEDNILKCEIHSGKPYRYFCFDCNKHYCTTCKSELSSHEKCNKVRLNRLNNRIDIEDIQSDIEAGYEHIEEYYLELKKEAINLIRQQIHNIQKAYDKAVNRNKTILSLVKDLIELYSNDYLNYYSIANIINNSTINLSEKLKEEEKTISGINTFFDKICILKQSVFKESNLLKYNSVKVLDRCRVLDIIKLGDKKIGYIANYTNFRIVNLQTFEQEYTSRLNGRLFSLTDTIFAISIYNNGIDILEYKNRKMFTRGTINNAHLSFVSMVKPINEDLFGTTSNDCTVKIWSLANNFSLVTSIELQGNANSLLGIKEKEILVVGYTNGFLKMWSTKTFQLMTQFAGIHCNNGNSIVQVKNRLIIIGNSMIHVINLNNYQILSRITDLKLLYYSTLIPINNELIYITGRASVFSLFTNQIDSKNDKTNKTRVETMNPFIIINNERFVAYNQGYIRVFKYSTN